MFKLKGQSTLKIERYREIQVKLLLKSIVNYKYIVDYNIKFVFEILTHF